MTDFLKYLVSNASIENKSIDISQYKKLYNQSINNSAEFWAQQAKNIEWISPFTKVKNTTFESTKVSIRWFEDGTLNLSYNCLDRHLNKYGNQIAIIWEGDDGNQSYSITYKELHFEVCRFANVLKKQGIGKGDVVTLYMPMIPEVSIAMLSCTRIGAIHSVIFAGFSSEAIVSRIMDSNTKLIITADYGFRAGRKIPLKEKIDNALKNPLITSVKNVIVFLRSDTNSVNWYNHRDLVWQDLIHSVNECCPAQEMNAEDPLFILYTSGSTGTPKGVLHTTGGYLVYITTTFKYVFNYRQNEIYWCTADIGWITGHSYLLYAPLSCGAITLMSEGTPNWPNINRMAKTIDKYQVNILYTAPTVIRTLMVENNKAIQDTQRTSLRILGTVGEPINPDAWQWYYKKIGNEMCPILDTWWQTETGGIIITPLPNIIKLKPGSAALPFFGIQLALVDNNGVLIHGVGKGNLVIVDSWPGQARTLYTDHDRFIKTYFSMFPGVYCTGDGARRDEDGYYWITGRIDDVLNVSGHRLGSAEIESVLVSHPKIVEAAVVGIPHKIKGQSICAYIKLNMNVQPTLSLYNEIYAWVRKKIGNIATPDALYWIQELPKTRSGKIMRRILRKIAIGDIDDLGDLSTLSDPEIIQKLVLEIKNIKKQMLST